MIRQFLFRLKRKTERDRHVFRELTRYKKTTVNHARPFFIRFFFQDSSDTHPARYSTMSASSVVLIRLLDRSNQSYSFAVFRQTESVPLPETQQRMQQQPERQRPRRPDRDCVDVTSVRRPGLQSPGFLACQGNWP